MFKLYNSEKFEVLTGKNPSVGLCTAWNEPKRIFKEVEQSVGITATLYSKYGINIIFRNLALNPSITKLYVWANGPLSNSQVGKMGHTTLKDIWKNKTPVIDDFNLEKEIKTDVIKKIISNVELIDVSNLSASDLAKKLKQQKPANKPYMKPVKFKEPKLGEFESFTSESAGWLVRGQKISDTWAKLVERIMRYGTTSKTQYGSEQKQLVGATWVIENEDVDNINFSYLNDLPKSVKENIVADIHSLKQYNKQVFEKSKTDNNVAYTYGNRLQKYPTIKGELNQVEEVLIGSLKKSINSRRATSTTIVPEVDSTSSEPPCLSLVQVLYDDNKLHMMATFRSQDIFKAGISNAYGLLNLQTKICKSLSVDKGSLIINSQSAHIYEQDFKDAQNICKCFFWEREPKMFWDHIENGDPRGNFLVSLNKDKIEVTLQGSNGTNLLTISGKSAKYLSLKIAQMELTNKIDHAMDIARQLQKAEIALKNGLQFKQDQPLKL